METNDIAAAAVAAGTSMNQSNGTRKQLYVVENENSYEYPKFLLERILERKRKNYKLESDLKKLRKLLNKLHQESVARRVEKAVVADIIELS